MKLILVPLLSMLSATVSASTHVRTAPRSFVSAGTGQTCFFQCPEVETVYKDTDTLYTHQSIGNEEVCNYYYDNYSGLYQCYYDHGTGALDANDGPQRCPSSAPIATCQASTENPNPATYWKRAKMARVKTEMELRLAARQYNPKKRAKRQKKTA